MSGSSNSGEGGLSYFMEGGEEVVTARVKEFFENKPRWMFEDTVGRGANGVIYRLKYSDGSNFQRLAVKVCPLDVDLGGNKSYDEDDEELPDEVLELDNERRLLRALRGCPHIISSLDVPNDPLAPTPGDGILPHRMRTWIFMEYAENGPLRQFASRYPEEYPDEPLPNRLLWRLFMCLARACVEMAYYNFQGRNGQEIDFSTAALEDLLDIRPGPLCHRDLASSNIVIGHLMPELQRAEHTISPILKVIDFGGSQVITGGNIDQTAAQVNVRDVGELISTLIVLGDFPLIRSRVTVLGETFDTFGGHLLTNYNELIRSGIDPALIHIAYYCLAVDPSRRPSPVQLAMQIRQHLNRNYPGVRKETDIAIKEIIQRLLLNPR